ncbi:MAG: lipocalin family protein [Bergeyella sp.]
MKKILLAGIVGATLLSCSAAKTAQNNRAEFLKLKGTWQITSVDFDKSYKVKPFGEGADAQCWVGSEWKLVPNNYTGSYTINGGGDCPSVTQPIKIDAADGTTFKFKKIADGTKAKQNLSGYTLSIVSQSEDQFSLADNSTEVRVVYNFQKVSK